MNSIINPITGELDYLGDSASVVVSGGLNPLGTYNPTTDYAVGDSVDYNGSSYVMFLDAPAGTLPTNTTYWQIIAKKGTDGYTPIKGVDYSDGKNGSDGSSATISVGTVTTIEPDQPATVTNSGTENAAVFNFEIPKGADGTGGGGAVSSVNGKTGDVVLDSSDVHALSDTTSIPTKTSDLTNDSGFVTDISEKVDKVTGKGLSTNDFTDDEKSKVDSALQTETDPTVPSWAKTPSKPTYTYSEVGADATGAAADALASAETFSANPANINQDSTHRFTNDTDISRLSNTSGTNTGDKPSSIIFDIGMEIEIQ